MNTVFGLWASFQTRENFLAALRTLRKTGYVHIDTATSQEVEELDENLGVHEKSNVLGLAALMGALSGIALGFGMQWYAMVIDTPLNIGGRPLNSWPSFIPITFILMILCAALSLTFTLFFRLHLPWPSHPLFFVRSFDLSKGTFDIIVSSEDPLFDMSQTRELLKSLKALDVEDIPWS